MRNSFDSVAYMRKARERLARKWEHESRSEEIRYLREKYGHLVKPKRKAVA